MKLNENGEIAINFTCSDFEGPFKLVIEGLTETGEPIRVVKIVNGE